MKLPKWLLWAGGTVLGLVLVFWLGGWGLLKSPFARKKAADELSKMLGVPVEVDDLDVGGTTKVSLRIPDAEADDNLVKIGGLDTDVSLGGLLTGHAAPTHVDAHDVDFLLRLNEKGEIISPLPKPKEGDANAAKPTIPEIKIAGGRVRLRQSGKPEFVLAGVTAHLQKDATGYALDGGADDPNWGKWKLSGHLSADFTDGSVSLTTDAANLRDDLLRSVPYVPVEVWDNLHASGPTGAAVTFTFATGSDLSYAVDLTPHKASLGIPAMKSTLTDVEGTIRVADGKVIVTNGKVGLAGGRGTLNGEYVFWQKGIAGTQPGEPLGVVKVKADAAGLDITRLPKEWGLDRLLLESGKLKGNADLSMVVARDGKLATSGGGDAEIVDPMLSIGGTVDEFKLKLRSKEGQYVFEQ